MLEAEFIRHIRSRGWQLKQKKSLLAVSGGIDSTAMVRLFHSAGLSFSVAHCNFQLRGAASEADEDFVRRLAAQYGADFHGARFDTEKYAREQGISIQMAAREMRYAWFETLCERHYYDYVATAHHLDDAVETSLLNYVRGSGPAGFTGIAEESGDLIIRPMLFCTRAEIVEYAAACSMEWREDESNSGDDYARNLLRHRVTPALESLNPNLPRTAARTHARMRAFEENYLFLLGRLLGVPAGLPEHFHLEIETLLKLPHPQYALYAVMHPLGFDEEQCRQAVENLHNTGFMLESEKGFRILVDRRFFRVRANHAEERPATLLITPDDMMVRFSDGGTLFFTTPAGQADFPDGKTAVVVEKTALNYPLELRLWAAGDRFQPFGMGGKSQKLQDFLTHQKLSRFEKEAVWVLVNGDGRLIWVLGHRMDDRFKIDPDKGDPLKITWIRE